MAQIIPKEQLSYNERLFKKGFRKKFHEARFFWLNRVLQNLHISESKLLEIGCFDGRSIEYLPFKPISYEGYDANWESGLDEGIKKWEKYPQYKFIFCDRVADFNPREKYAITLAMETLEHFPLNELETYIQKIHAVTEQYFLITVPIEKGPLVAFKHLMKRLFFAIDEPYSFKELFYASIGMLQHVSRIEFGHKGFDYKELVKILDKYFTIEKIQGLPFSILPKYMNFTIGIIAKPK